MRAPGEEYALIRTAKLKAFVSGKDMSRTAKTAAQCIYDAAEHELRLKPVKNADQSKLPSNHLIVFTKDDQMEDLDFETGRQRGLLRRDLFQSLTLDCMKARGIDPATLRKDQVLAQQVQVSASYTFFTREPAKVRDLSEEFPTTNFIVDERYRLWRSDSIKFLKEKYADRLVAIVEHLDELTPHMTGVVVPLVFKSVKGPGRGSKKQEPPAAVWRLAAFDVFNRKTLRELWTEYAAAMKDHGLIRPPGNVIAKSLTVHSFYASVSDAENTSLKIEESLSFCLPEVRKKIFPESAKDYRERAQQEFATWQGGVRQLIRDLHYQAEAVSQLRKRETELRRALSERDKHLAAEKDKTVRLARESEATRSLITDIVPGRVLKTLGLGLEVEGDKTWRSNLPDGRVVRVKVNSFTIHSKDKSGHTKSGIGAIDFIEAIFNTNVTDAIRKCVMLFGPSAMGAIHSWFERHFNAQPAPTAVRELSALLQPAKQSLNEKAPSIPKTFDVQQPNHDQEK